MSKYHYIKGFFDSEIPLYPTLGAIAEFEDIRGKNFLESMAMERPLTKDVFTMIYQCHLTASQRLKESPKVSMELLMDKLSYLDAREVLDSMSEDLLKCYGVDVKIDIKEQDQEEKKT